ncbi:hypothetical protein E2562_030900 [Oryza meyeriana var. granulata]|uniref:Uncharacterized protein n=1 Tax=Oryza meyeriana var. granulata TaxID=110450 RepID=A0A6G1F032_9ORYZ|nr:hypothetical protein E2562_030900 [Oryza meyeriana var. granulata]
MVLECANLDAISRNGKWITVRTDVVIVVIITCDAGGGCAFLLPPPPPLVVVAAVGSETAQQGEDIRG